MSLEGFRAIGLQIVGSSNVIDGGLADALVLRHSPATLVHHARGFGLQGCLYDGGDFFYRIDGHQSPAWSHVHRPRHWTQPAAQRHLLRSAWAPIHCCIFCRVCSHLSPGLGFASDTGCHCMFPCAPIPTHAKGPKARHDPRSTPDTALCAHSLTGGVAAPGNTRSGVFT